VSFDPESWFEVRASQMATFRAGCLVGGMCGDAAVSKRGNWVPADWKPITQMQLTGSLLSPMHPTPQDATIMPNYLPHFPVWMLSTKSW